MATARKQNSGNYRIRVYVGRSADGKAQYRSFTARTKKDAEYAAAQYMRANIETERSDILLKQAVERYIKSKENVLSPTTVKGYYAILRNWLPDLMEMQVKRITQETLQENFNRFALDHSPKTCRNAHGLISAVLKIHRPELTLHTTLPPKKKRDIYVPDEQEVRRYLILAHNTGLEIPLLLATQCGLRASEISGLTLENVHKDHIDIKQARVDGINGEAIKAPKSAAGYRTIPISETLYNIIVSHAVGERVCEYRANYISSKWQKFRKRHNLPLQLNFHALRHHYASKCLLMGMPQKYIAALMGHSSVDMIEKVYQHIFPSAMEVYANELRQNMDIALYVENYNINDNDNSNDN